MTVVSPLKGPRKAAILLILLGEAVAAEIYRHLSDEEVQLITEELAYISHVTPDLAKQVIDEYNELTQTQEYLSAGGMQFATRLLVSAYGEERAKTLLDDVIRAQARSASKLDSLQKADPQQLAKFLESEHPQTIALVLGHMEARQASLLLMRLPEDIRADAVKRLSQLRQFSPEVAERVSTVLNRKLQSLGEQSRRTYAGFKSVADLMNRLDPTSAKDILATIERDEPKLALSIRNLMFTFEDLLGVPEVSLREFVANLDKRTLAMALKNASEDLKNHIFRTMSSRAVDMMKEDMDAMGAVRSRDVTKAQQDAVAVARKLEAEGKIILKSEGDDEFVL